MDVRYKQDDRLELADISHCRRNRTAWSSDGHLEFDARQVYCSVMARPRILYFDIRGRVEPLRLIFEHLGVEYQDDRIASLEAWARLKPDLPFGELPLFEEGELVMVQSQAILRHVARSRGLCGVGEPEMAECEMAEEALVEARELLWRYQWRTNQEETKDAFIANELSPRLAALTAWYETHGAEGRWVNGRLTYVDFLAFAFLDELRAFFPETLATFGPLYAFHRRFGEEPRIAAYLASDRRPAAFGYAVHGLKIDPQYAG